MTRKEEKEKLVGGGFEGYGRSSYMLLLLLLLSMDPNSVQRPRFCSFEPRLIRGELGAQWTRRVQQQQQLLCKLVRAFFLDEKRYRHGQAVHWRNERRCDIRGASE
jgi:hypothetical protein